MHSPAARVQSRGRLPTDPLVDVVLGGMLPPIRIPTFLVDSERQGVRRWLKRMQEDECVALAGLKVKR